VCTEFTSSDHDENAVHFNHLGPVLQ